jgi:hypothetical protein
VVVDGDTVELAASLSNRERRAVAAFARSSTTKPVTVTMPTIGSDSTAFEVQRT